VSIRFKVVIPYLVLTLIVAITGAYVVTKLVTNSLTERLNNQLLEAGRVVSDSFVRQEIQHVDNARVVVFTNGMAEALRDEDHTALASLGTPTAGGLGLENLIIVNMQAQRLLHLHSQPEEIFLDVSEPSQEIALDIVQTLLDSRNPDNPPTRAIRKDPVNNHWYYFSAIPFSVGNEMIGVVIVGTSMDTIVAYLKETSLADIVIYRESGKAISSTLQAQGEDESIFRTTLSIPETDYQKAATAEKLVFGENLSIGERSYSLARGKLQVGGDLLGVFSVVLPSDYVVQTGAVNRNLYVVIFSLAMVFVVVLGFFISRRITNPLSSLVRASQAIARGDLTRRTGIQSKDEIGTLAVTFDEMTENLQERTLQLERTNQLLEQMDRTKSSFIKISAHELRTPLTLIQGYAYMLQQRAEEDSEIAPLADGLMEGFNRMEEVVNSMLDVSKIDSKTLKVKAADAKVNLIIAKAHKPFASAMEERNLQFTTDGLDKLPVISVDKEMMHKVFYHVIMNAIKYTPDGGKISVCGKAINDAANPEVEITVSDTGIGVAPKNHELVFEKFYQTGEVMLHSSGKTKFKGGGPGLGLAIARGIVEAHGGRIWLNSPGYDEETNPGTTVYVRLPVNGQNA
jgi:signal transduction histidine kinase